MDNVKQNGTWDQVAGKWKQFTGSIRAKWGDLTDNDLEEIKGNRDIMAGKIQERYGIAREEAHRQLEEWEKSLKL